MDSHDKIQLLKSEIEQLKLRNKLVESNKAWETSLTRRLFIATCTYLTVWLFLIVIGTPKPYIHAIVPSLGFILSTLSLPVVKKYWLNHWYGQK